MLVRGERSEGSGANGVRREADAGSESPVVFLMGPTASGKTELATYLAEKLPCEIISVDSAMVYRGMDIGTAKPTAGELAQTPHRLIDIRDPVEPYSAATFRSDALREITEIHASGRIPLLVGGTMLYFKALEQGLSHLPEANPQIRANLAEQGERLGWAALHARLAEHDTQSAARIHPNDAQRIQRALEVLEISGEPPSAWYAREGSDALPWPVIKLAVAPADREVLHTRIEQRFQQMLEKGFLAEVEKLHRRPDLDLGKPALRAVGYCQLWRYLDDEWTLDEAMQRAVFATRQLAKRQLTWLRRTPQVPMLDSTGKTRFAEAEKMLITGLNQAKPC